MQAYKFIEDLKHDPEYRGQIAHIERIPARRAGYGRLRQPLPKELDYALRDEGIVRLYKHQTEAVNAARRGENVVAVTSTASGKTLCYNLPVLEAMLQDPKARAFYIYPTKALAQDQLGKLKRYPLDVTKYAATYDGDTPKYLRSQIRRNSRIILTNPDMLHIAILPYHTLWAQFLQNLKYVVIDEIHTYRGVFGSNVANIIRRLRRICSYYGSNPQFVCTSATIANPAEHFTRMTGLEATVIDEDTSPAGAKWFVFWNPPFLSQKDIRRSTNLEAVHLFTRLINSGVRTIVFTLARKSAELIFRYTRESLTRTNSPAIDRIMSYRAGYKPAERRKIEQRLFKGELLGVTSTNALELGIDVGKLDATIITGYPGSIASTWQQAGRAGRSQAESLAVLVALDNPIDQFLMRHPDYFFEHAHEKAVIDPDNPYVLSAHLVCAANELPIENEELELFGERVYDVLVELGESGDLDYRSRWYWNGKNNPTRDVNIRSASSNHYDIVDVDTVQLLGTVDAATAFETIHPGAIYLHGGESYVVTRLDLEERAAYVSAADLPYYTIPCTSTSIAETNRCESKQFHRTKANLSDALVTGQVTGFRKKQLATDQVINVLPLKLPESKFLTQAVWFPIPKEIVDRAVGRGFDPLGSIHAIEHATIGILPLFAMCDRQDIGGISSPAHSDAQKLAAIFIYDAHPGGVGIAQTAYERLEEVFEATLKTIEDCTCTDGCPSCVQSPKCGNNNEPLDKAGAAFLLREILS